MLKNLIFVFIGGGLGCVSRYAIALVLQHKQLMLKGFPLHTFLVNFVGCLLIGMLAGYFMRNPNHSAQLIFISGFCGGFTTFSTFSLESLTLYRNGQYGIFATYLILSLVLCIFATLIGLLLIKH